MEDGIRAKYRVDALNLAYGILQQRYAVSPAPGSLTNPVPNTEAVLREAEKLTEFIEK